MIKLPSLKKILYKEVEKFRGQVGLNDIYFFWKNISDGYFIILKYQRKDIWSLEQKQNFIRSLYYGITILPIILNTRTNYKNRNYEDEFYYYVVDGGQRIRTLQQFFNNELEVDGFKWNSIHKSFKTQFLNIPLQTIRTSFKNEEEEKMYYRLFNTSGTFHTEKDIKKAL